MPVGSGPGPGTPPPTDAGVCAISPSDLVGFVGNALSRIKELEQRVAELEAANVEANQLSDITQQVGWVGGVTYMGIEGWTQTSTGTLIPPPGVTLSTLGIIPPTIPGSTSGVQFQITDANGNPVFGADLLGQLFGDQVDIWNTANAPDYGIARYANAFGTNYGWYSDSRGVTIGTQDEVMPGSIVMTITEDGLYQVDAYASILLAGAGTVDFYLYVTNSGRGNTDEIVSNKREEVAVGAGAAVACSGIMEGLAGSTFTAFISTVPGSGLSASAFGLSIHKISSL